MTSKQICVAKHQFDPKRLVLLDAKITTYKIGSNNISVCRSAAKYKDDQGVLCDVYFELPEQYVFGVSPKYPFGTSKEQETPDKIEGYQVCYPLTSLETMESPTEDEQYVDNLFTSIWEISVDKAKEEATKEEPVVPPTTINSFIGAGHSGKMENALKPAFEYKKSEDGKTLDKSKPKRAYIPLVSTGKKGKIDVKTKFYAPGDKPVNPMRYVGVKGIIAPAVQFVGISYGPQGSNNPQGAKLKFTIAQGNYTPSGQGVPTARLLPGNSAPSGEDDDDMDLSGSTTGTTRDLTHHATGFAPIGNGDSSTISAVATNGNGATPADLLKKVTAPKPVVPKAKSVPTTVTPTVVPTPVPKTILKKPSPIPTTPTVPTTKVATPTTAVKKPAPTGAVTPPPVATTKVPAKPIAKAIKSAPKVVQAPPEDVAEEDVENEDADD